MQQYALLKCVGRNEYVVVKYTDHCLGVLSYFLTDGGTPDNFRSWIDQTKKGVKSGKVTFIRKDGDYILIGLDPVITGQQDQFETTTQDLLSYIDCWKKECDRNANEILIKRDGKKITFEGKMVTNL